MSVSKTLKIKPDVLKSLRYYARQRTPMVLKHFEKKSKLGFGVDAGFLKDIETSETYFEFSSSSPVKSTT